MCRPQDFGRAKYELVTSVRTHLGGQDDAFGCMGVAEDAEGVQGVFLKKNVIEIAGRALKTNIIALAPKVLPWSQLVSSPLRAQIRATESNQFRNLHQDPAGRG